MISFVFLIAILLLVGGLILYRRSGQQQQAAGLPRGEVIYTDTSNWRRAEHSLFSRRYQLTGKPDYLVETGDGVIPVEVKTTRLSGFDPYDSHKLQLAAYCLLIEDSTGQRPPHGILKYADAVIRLPYTDDLRRELLAVLAAMRASDSAHDIARSHDDPLRCVRCGFRHACGPQALSDSEGKRTI